MKTEENISVQLPISRLSSSEYGMDLVVFALEILQITGLGEQVVKRTDLLLCIAIVFFFFNFT